MKSILKHSALSAFFAFFAFLLLTGCASTKTARALPSYPAALDEAQFDKTCPVEVYYDDYSASTKNVDYDKLKTDEEKAAYQKKIAISAILGQFRTHGYTNIRSGAHFESKPVDNVPIVDIATCKAEDVQLRNQDAVESVIVVSVRQPGKYVNRSFVRNQPRYFQAIGQAYIGKSKRVNAVNEATSDAVRNLFKIQEFRRALSPAR